MGYLKDKPAMDPKVRYLLDEAIAALPKKVDLVYVDYRDQFSEEQVKMLLAGDMEGVWDSTSEWESDQQHHNVRMLLDEVCDDSDDAEAIFNDDEAWEEFREECQERDESTWFDALLRNTPGVMIRYDLDHEVESYMVSSDQVETQARDIAEATGLDYKTNETELRSLVLNASYGGMLCVLHRSDVADAMEVTTWGREGKGGKVIFTDPQLLIYDGMNGSGHMEQVVGRITVEITDDTMRLDVGSYSWSDGIAGIVHSCADTPAEFIKPSEEEDVINTDSK